MHGEESLNGYIIREETLINKENTGENIEKIKTEGEKVSKGDAIGKYYTIEKEEVEDEINNINKEIQDALEQETDIFSSDIKALDTQIENKLIQIASKNNIQTISENKKDIRNYITKKAKITGDLSPSGSHIKTLIEQRNSLEKNLLEGSKTIISPESGVVSYRIDGLEEALKIANVDSLTIEMLENLETKTGKIINTSNDKLKVVNNYKCYIAVISNSEDANKAEVGDSLNIKLSTGEEVKSTIEYIKEQNNSRILVLKITKHVEELINYRKISLELIWWRAKGLKVPNSAIIYQDGLSYIIKRVNINERKILVKIIKENENYSIVNSYNTEELMSLGYKEEEINNMDKIKLYDEIVVNPGL